MWEYMQRRARQCAEYILETGATVRACAAHFGVSKSTVHKDITERLAEIDGALCEEVRKVLDKNLAERHLARRRRHPPQIFRPPRGAKAPAQTAPRRTGQGRRPLKRPLTKEKGQRYRKNRGLTKRRFMV